MLAMSGAATSDTQTFRRASGLGTLAVLIVLGVGVTSGYLQWKAPDLRARVASIRSEVAVAPASPEGRLANWAVYGDPLIHNRLLQMRFSAEQPWLVTHAVGTSPAALEIYGIDLTDMPRDIVRIEGLRAIVHLPAPRLLGIGPLTGDHASFVPVYPAESSAPAATERARELGRYALEGLGHALARDIEGASLAVEIGPESSFAEITANDRDLPPAAK